MPKTILEQLAEGPVLGDGGYVYILKQRGVPMGGYTPYGILTHADAIRQLYAEFFQAGVDVIQAQTFQGTRNRLEQVGMADRSMDDILAAVAAATATGLPVIATVSIKAEPNLDDGTSPAECARPLRTAGADALGINCMREPARMLPLAREMRAAVDGFLATQPIGFRCGPEYTHLHTVPDGTERVLSPEARAEYAREAAAIGINYIGSCCGSGAEQVRAMPEAPGKRHRG